MKIEEVADSATLLDATAVEAATAFYDDAVRFGIAKYPKAGIRKCRNWNKFVQIARKCIIGKIQVTKFVHAAFSKAMERHPIVTVSDIVSADTQSVLKSEDGLSGTSSPQDMWNLMSCKLIDMVFSLDGVKDKIDILDSTMYGFPAWFRVFSPKEPIRRIILHWGDLAFEELSEDPALDDYLKSKRGSTYSLLKSVMKMI